MSVTGYNDVVMCYERMTVSVLSDRWILWLKVLGPEVDQRNMEGSDSWGHENLENKYGRCIAPQ